MCDKTLIECPECREMATVTSSSFSATISCECGILEIDSMVEED